MQGVAPTLSIKMFTDRRDAGRRLAEALEKYKGSDGVILGIPRGGVVVADEVASFINFPLSLIIPRKIGAPGNPELAIGATAGGDRIVLNREVIRALNVSDDYIKEAATRENVEIKRREQEYLQNKARPEIKDKVVIIVDDGIATGSTAEAAVLAVKSKSPEKIVLAVPVAPPETARRFQEITDEVVVLLSPSSFYAVGQFYDLFKQTTDREVIEILKKY